VYQASSSSLALLDTILYDRQMAWSDMRQQRLCIAMGR